MLEVSLKIGKKGKPSGAQLRALHGKAAELDRLREQEPGTAKRDTLAAAAEHFRIQVERANDLATDQMSWALDRLTYKIWEAKIRDGIQKLAGWEARQT